jgi:hypothetical protein
MRSASQSDPVEDTKRNHAAQAHERLLVRGENMRQRLRRFGQLAHQNLVEKLVHCSCLACAVNNNKIKTINYTNDKIHTKIT